ncbi:MAG: nicotinamidase, partial [Phascolarctobacterium sp.]|nr:nicotinamidase [Phascolarctobacterium sp.]
MKLPEKKYIASFDIDAQNTFTPICPNELPVVEGDQIADELNAQAKFASLRIASRDAHTNEALWLSNETNPPLSPIEGHPDLDIRWPAHAIIGTKGFDFIPGLDPAAYDFQVYKG